MSDRIGKSVIAGAILAVVTAIVLLVLRYPMGGIFGFIERTLYLWIILGTLAYMVLSAGDALSYARSVPKEKLVPVILLLPVGILVAVAVNLLIGQPLIGWIMSLITRDDVSSVSSGAFAALVGLYIWFFLAKDSEYRHWPKQLGIFAIGGIVGALLPYGIALIFLIIGGSVAYKMGLGASLGKYATAREEKLITNGPQSPEEEAAYRQAIQNVNTRAGNQTPVQRNIFDDDE